ncbi:MAG: hypothetical protein UY05_C0059G0003 [Candidatus Peregrinibacteria bacterium GW2011_GWA2_47_7]|nr:MAG: hypothetical protein UY05_C0059G0003 [Candidatus Peregrinibacteria bacterium GW2011_GWA2_47_7]
MEHKLNGHGIPTHHPQTLREKIDATVAQGFEAVCLAITIETKLKQEERCASIFR